MTIATFGGEVKFNRWLASKAGRQELEHALRFYVGDSARAANFRLGRACGEPNKVRMKTSGEGDLLFPYQIAPDKGALLIESASQLDAAHWGKGLHYLLDLKPSRGMTPPDTLIFLCDSCVVSPTIDRFADWMVQGTFGRVIRVIAFVVDSVPNGSQWALQLRRTAGTHVFGGEAHSPDRGEGISEREIQRTWDLSPKMVRSILTKPIAVERFLRKDLSDVRMPPMASKGGRRLIPVEDIESLFDKVTSTQGCPYLRSSDLCKDDVYGLGSSRTSRVLGVRRNTVSERLHQIRRDIRRRGLQPKGWTFIKGPKAAFVLSSADAARIAEMLHARSER
jgi:hypothetical protein